MTSQAPRFTSKLAGQKILLIGATGGIGICVAQGLIEFGATVYLSSSREARVNECVRSILADYPSAKGRIYGYPCDLSSQQVETNLEQLFEKVGKVNHIVFMAGERLPTVPLEDVSLEKMQETFHIRTFAAMLTAKVGIRYLKKDRSSSVTFTTGSICEKPIAGGWGMLAAIGAATPGLTRQLAFDMAPIRVNCVAPGVVATDFWSGMGTEQAEAYLKAHESKMLTQKVAQPEDVAEAFLYVIRDMNTTGQVVHTNSGVFLV
jgi:NAD(P)-dependent dehydrogenase (short-subunit alcohol dehydrogenase family)